MRRFLPIFHPCFPSMFLGSYLLDKYHSRIPASLSLSLFLTIFWSAICHLSSILFPVLVFDPSSLFLRSYPSMFCDGRQARVVISIQYPCSFSGLPTSICRFRFPILSLRFLFPVSHSASYLIVSFHSQYPKKPSAPLPRSPQSTRKRQKCGVNFVTTCIVYLHPYSTLVSLVPSMH